MEIPSGPLLGPQHFLIPGVAHEILRRRFSLNSREEIKKKIDVIKFFQHFSCKQAEKNLIYLNFFSDVLYLVSVSHAFK